MTYRKNIYSVHFDNDSLAQTFDFWNYKFKRKQRKWEETFGFGNAFHLFFKLPCDYSTALNMPLLTKS